MRVRAHHRDARLATLDKGLVLACWWVVTRSMVAHAMTLGALLIFFTPHQAAISSPSYDLVLHWAPIDAWGALVALAALVWLLTRGWICVAAGIVVALWFFAFASAFFAAWLNLHVPNTTVTAWATYLFLGWAWLCVTYVVWKDEEHIRLELAQMTTLTQLSEELHHPDSG